MNEHSSFRRASFHQPDVAKLIVRVTCGGLLILHGSNSALHGIQHVKDMVNNAGLPEFIAYGNLVGEVIAPLFMIIGYKTRIAALVVAFNMLMSILIAHRDIVFARNDFGGWMIELNVFYFMTALAVFFAGSGKYSLSGGKGKWD
jgi:putative oxidoreductase